MKHAGEKFTLSLILGAIGMFTHGFVLSKLWSWFIANIFNISEITIVQAVGIIFVIDFIFLKVDWTEHMEKSELNDFVTKIVAHTITTPFILLGIGYIITLFL